MADNKISMPGPFGGLVRYDEEYNSRFQITPGQVLVFIAAVAVFAIALKLIWPIAIPVA